MKNIIKERSFQFAVDIVRLCSQIKSWNPIVSNQLMRCGTSVGANVREAINAESKADFIHKLQISQKECAETLYWLEIVEALEILPIGLLITIQQEAFELLKILRSIILTTKRNQTKKANDQGKGRPQRANHHLPTISP